MNKKIKSFLTSDKVSILMTVFNAEKYLKKSIGSIENQTYKNWELIIIDDKSSDQSHQLLKVLRIRK